MITSLLKLPFNLVAFYTEQWGTIHCPSLTVCASQLVTFYSNHYSLEDTKGIKEDSEQRPKSQGLILRHCIC